MAVRMRSLFGEPLSFVVESITKFSSFRQLLNTLVQLCTFFYKNLELFPPLLNKNILSWNKRTCFFERPPVLSSGKREFPAEKHTL